MERLSDVAIEIVDDLHTECLNYYTGYIPLINALNKLSDLEDAEENGTLIKGKFKPGDEVWAIDTANDICRFVFIAESVGYAILTDGLNNFNFEARMAAMHEVTLKLNGVEVYILMMTSVFATREEAEAELKRREVNG